MSPPTYPQDDASRAAPVSHDPTPPTYAAFSPTNIAGTSLTSRQRSTIIVHRKSPLLVATPPAITRALAYSHPFLLPLNHLVGLLSWTSGDPWESFLLVAAFWAIVLYGSEIILWAGPILVVLGLILGMYSRRYSPLSSTGLTGEKHHGRGDSADGSPQRHKSLDEIVETLRTLTMRCNILLEPLLELTDFLSTQRTATSATTRPALTALLARIVLVTPVWILLTLRPFYLITTKRVVLTVGTIILTWHSKPTRISRVILWRSLTIRWICSIITGLSFSTSPYVEDKKSSNDSSKSSLLSLRAFRRRSSTNNHGTDISTKRRRADPSGVRFTFILFENQRRWLGIGWTQSLFAYERAPWTDEHLNTAPSKDEFELPDVPGGNARWRWVPGSEWRVDGVPVDTSPKKSGPGQNNNGKGGEDGGWIYYDNKWNDGRRGQDSWGRYTRRRKWYRDAELVEITSSTEATPPPSPAPEKAASTSHLDGTKHEEDSNPDDNGRKEATPSTSSKARKRRWFGSSDLSKELSSSAPQVAAGSTSSLPAIEAFTTAADPSSIQPSSSLPSVHSGSFPGSARGGGSSSGKNSTRGRRASKAGSSTIDTDRDSLSRSVRDEEIEQAETMVDKFEARPGGAAERAERGWGLGDDAHMGLS
ncbi:hypothetical protein AJ80_03298 [Polytolypa hystricis UAMH7299]|uniref:Peroxin/Ferlin domain-containing protein n=1 Tax=Polytolypa hystricis (strain UAMH7299) TaxID=1447883 RepID=A0A2B7YK03_POLH7|nr:hypothetical protein AJ80_03298 [Polytolypa hystricis UAMH7299]